MTCWIFPSLPRLHACCGRGGFGPFAPAAPAPNETMTARVTTPSSVTARRLLPHFMPIPPNRTPDGKDAMSPAPPDNVPPGDHSETTGLPRNGVDPLGLADGHRRTAAGLRGAGLVASRAAARRALRRD